MALDLAVRHEEGGFLVRSDSDFSSRVRPRLRHTNELDDSKRMERFVELS